jgi:hypothetical protein
MSRSTSTALPGEELKIVTWPATALPWPVPTRKPEDVAAAEAK